MLEREVITGRRQAVEPSNIHFPVLYFTAVEHFQKKRFVTRPTFNDDDAIQQHSPKAGHCFPSVLAIGDDLGDHGVELCGNALALGYTRVNTHTRSCPNPKTLN